MIKIKLSALTNEAPTEMPIEDGEFLSVAIDRALENIPLEELKKEDVFQILVNGHKIQPEFWAIIKLDKNDNVMIAPKLGDSDGSLLRSALMIVVVAAAAYFLGPEGANLAGAELAGATAAATMVGGLLINALVPPPVPDAPGVNGPLADSQMYSITSQSNATRKMQTVFRNYGYNRVFPAVGANPYVDTVADPVSGQLVQYLYVIYDFGFGPLNISNISIGDTLISDYDDVTYNLVDPNRPVISEGPWDDAVLSDFQIYKSDTNVDSIGSEINANREDGGPEAGYTLNRTGAINPGGDKQTLTITLVNPQGLYSFDTGGQQGWGNIDLEIQFSKVGEDNWKNFNDVNYVDNFDAVGGGITISQPVGLYPCSPPGTNSVYPLLYKSPPFQYVDPFEAIAFPHSARSYVVNSYQYGIPAGTTQYVVDNTNTDVFSQIIPGTTFYLSGSPLGKVVSIDPYIPDSNFSIVTLDVPSPEIMLYREWAGTDIVTNQYHPDIALTFNYHPPGKFTISTYPEGQTSTKYSTVSFTPKESAQFKIRIIRAATQYHYSLKRTGDLEVLSLQSKFARKPITTKNRHVFMELRIRATNQLNGTIQNLNATVASVLPVYDGTDWTLQETANPAWVFADLLTGEVNKRAIDKSRLHTPSLLEWAAYADAVPTPPPGGLYTFPRFATNFILDYETTLQSVLLQVTGAAQASPNIVDGKYGVLIDKNRTIPVQVFTPRNSSDFGSSRNYTTRPDSVNVQWVDPGSGWTVNEQVVYDDGFDVSTAVTSDSLTSFACTNSEQAWRFGRYMMAQNRLRQETITIKVDFENLVCTRGDYVQITQDVMRAGGKPARVSAIAGNRVTIDDALDLSGFGSLAFVFRGADGIVQGSLSLVGGSPDTFDLGGSIFPQVGDLFVVGEAGEVVFDCIVKSISPNDDMTATLTLVEKADAIYEAESLTTLPNYNANISTTSDPNQTPPGAVQDFAVADNFWQCSGGDYEYYIDLVWNAPIGSAYELFQVFANSGSGFTEAGETRGTTFHYIVDPANLGTEHQFKVVAVSASGLKIDLGSAVAVSATPVEKTTAPSDVTTFSSNITDQVLQLSWQPIADCDALYYLIRYSPTDFGTWNTTIPLAKVSATQSSVAVQARTGVYLIKAVDFNGNESANFAEVITTIPNLFNLNIIEETSDFPTLAGSKDRVVKLAGALILDTTVSGGSGVIQYYSDGYYYYNNLLDLGDIFTVRLQSLIQAEGYTAADLMANWLTLASVTSLANTGASDWDVQAEYRSTNELNVIGEWDVLADIDPLSEGVQTNFTPWRPFIMGDATGRIFEFRLHLISNKASVSPRVFDGKIRADMPDRFESYNDLAATIADGYTLTYDPPFKGPGSSPNVQVSIESAESGDYWTFDSKTLTGLTIRLYDKNNNPVDRTIDIAVKGYGHLATAVI